MGISAPVGVAFKSDTGTLIVAGANGQAVEASRAGEALAEAFSVAGKGVTLAVDAAGAVLTSDSAVAEGAVFDAGLGALLVLEGDEFVNTASGERIRLQGAGNGPNRGLAIDPVNGLIYVGSPSGKFVRVFDRGGNPVQKLDLSAIDIGDQQGMAIAPSADPTDDPNVQRLYLADASGALLEVGIQAEPVTVTAAITSTASLVRTYQTWQWSPPSPDPSGITWIPDRQQLLVSDGEVDEMSIFQNVNIWYVRPPTGTIAQTANTNSFNGEPTGLAYDTAGARRIFVSNDNSGGYVDIIRPGTDGNFWTTDDVRTRMLTNGFGLPVDTEGVAYHQGNGHLYIADGVGREVWDVDPGNNGNFDGGGDDIITHFDVQQYGVLDPSGIDYSPTSGRLLLIDDRSETVYELATNGSLVNAIDITAANGVRMDGVALAPASNGSGENRLYVVDRVVDNDSDPNENDGRMYELTAPLAGGGPGNQPPVANAGPDQNVSRTLPTSITLDATGSVDDSAISTYLWERISGPTSASVNTPNQATTTVGISETGTYVFRLTITDGQGLSDTDEVSVIVSAPGGSSSWDGVIAVGADDAEQLGDNSMRLANANLELVVKGTDTQVVGLRFINVAIPQGAEIQSAYVQFRSDGASTGTSNLSIRAQASDNASPFISQASNLTNRPTGGSVSWSPPGWPTDNQVGPDQRTADISNLIEEVVARPGWQSGNALALIFTGTGTRIANALEGGFASELHVTFGGGASTNDPPVAVAGPDQSLSSATLPASASLDGTGSTDDNGISSYSWSQVNGPGTATIATPNQATTSVGLPAYGTYTFRLTVTDAESLSDTDDVVVTVADSSGSQTLNIPVPTGSDDVEENVNGRIIFPNGDLDLVLDSSTNMVVGLRFTNVQIPLGATITNAYIQFRSDEVQSGTTNLVVRAHDVANAPAFSSTKFSLSNRPRTSASVAWAPVPWTANRLAGPEQRTSNLAAIVSELTATGSGWSSGNAMVFIITGTGKRTADSFEGGFAPRLVVEFTS